MAIAATDDQAVNEAVHAAAVARGIPVNVVDQPRLCTFAMPAIIDRSPILIAISTGGTSPVLARLLRARLESLIPAGLGRLAALGEQFRSLVKRRIVQPESRRLFWERIFGGPVSELALGGQDERARARPSCRRSSAPSTSKRPTARSTWWARGRAIPICSPSGRCA